jgi:hypothetical protein
MNSLLERGAAFDPTGTYRYCLWRCWDAGRPRVTFIMLNPSTADAVRDDPTIRRCMAFVCSWGGGSLEVVNLFAYRTGRPALLRAAPDPVGPRNDWYLLRAARRADRLIAAWGNHGVLHARDRTVLHLLADQAELFCLGTTRLGQPRHPLYVRAGTVPIVFPRIEPPRN